ncbi:MAG TPA: efflux RND transporter periplasmic adaptor subunit [Candidatus Aquilonibacter sp.]|nr:efflux RND transporter periplasmic adaptor subunit [Candidatus Aquilonibacter sp.]
MFDSSIKILFIPAGDEDLPMKKRKIVLTILVLAIVAGGVYYALTRPPAEIVLTGIVTTDEVIVSSEIQGRLQELLVKEGNSVTNGELLAVIQPQEQLANVAFYASSEQQSAADLAQAQADLENARLNFERIQGLYSNKVESVQDYDQMRTAYEAAKAGVESVKEQIQAAAAQKKKAAVQLSYTKIFAPNAGIVDTRVALQGEVVNPGQAIVTLINQDDLWVRADVEESYIDRIHLGDKIQVKLPSGATREGTVFYRGVDADYATQRDVSRTKRDIKTFEIRLRCDNSDRALAVGMTAYITLPLK